MYFCEDAFTADTDYIELPVESAIEPHGEWSGPAELQAVWLKAITATTVVELVVFQRRG